MRLVAGKRGEKIAVRSASRAHIRSAAGLVHGFQTASMGREPERAILGLMAANPR